MQFQNCWKTLALPKTSCKILISNQNKNVDLNNNNNIQIKSLTSVEFCGPPPRIAVSLISIFWFFFQSSQCKYMKNYPKFKSFKSRSSNCTLHGNTRSHDSSSHEYEINPSTLWWHQCWVSLWRQCVTHIWSCLPPKDEQVKSSVRKCKMPSSFCLKERVVKEKPRWTRRHQTSRGNLPVNLRTEILLMWQIDLFSHILFQLLLRMMHRWKSL